jgi:MarR family
MNETETSPFDASNVAAPNPNPKPHRLSPLKLYLPSGDGIWYRFFDAWRDEILKETASSVPLPLAEILWRRRTMGWEHGPISFEQLASALHCDAQTVGRALTLLERLGLIQTLRRRGTFPIISWIRPEPVRSKNKN